MTDPIQTLWGDDGADARPLAPAELQRRARSLRRRTWTRDAVEYASGLLGAGVFAVYWARAANPLIAAGCALTIAATALVMAGLWRRRVRAAPDAAAEASVRYLRAQLVQQRDTLASVGRWYLAPVVPGLLLFVAGVWQDLAARRGEGEATIVALVTLAVVGTVFALVLTANRRAARGLSAQIAALDRADTDI